MQGGKVLKLQTDLPQSLVTFPVFWVAGMWFVETLCQSGIRPVRWWNWDPGWCIPYIESHAPPGECSHWNCPHKETGPFNHMVFIIQGCLVTAKLPFHSLSRLNNIPIYYCVFDKCMHTAVSSLIKYCPWNDQTIDKYVQSI